MFYLTCLDIRKDIRRMNAHNKTIVIFVMKNVRIIKAWRKGGGYQRLLKIELLQCTLHLDTLKNLKGFLKDTKRPLLAS